MGEYADVKRNKILKLLKWLNTLNGFHVDNGGKHQWLIKHDTWSRPYPIPFKHNTVNKHIVKDLVRKIVTTKQCSKDDIDEYLR